MIFLFIVYYSYDKQKRKVSKQFANNCLIIHNHYYYEFKREFVYFKKGNDYRYKYLNIALMTLMNVCIPNELLFTFIIF